MLGSKVDTVRLSNDELLEQPRKSFEEPGIGEAIFKSCEVVEPVEERAKGGVGSGDEVAKAQRRERMRQGVVVGRG